MGQQLSARPIRLSRVERHALTRQRVLDGAKSVFVRLGYGGASIESIAAEAGYSRGAVYFSFPNKEALFIELLRLHTERKTAELEKIASLEPARLIGALTDWLKTTHADIGFTQLVVELQLLAWRSPEFAVRYNPLREDLDRALGGILETYFKACGKIRAVEALDMAGCITALSLVHGLQHCAGKPDSPDKSGRFIDAMLRALIHV
ncbi:UNVERIFIED_ORG: TetR family transcriptional regulator [Burkholderia sp. CF145]|jgi:AcrR family transcriptional regulator